MSDPIKELIAVNILADINAITTGNGYNQTLVGLRSRRNDFTDIAPEDLKVLVYQADEENGDDLMEATVVSEMVQPFVLLALVIDSDDATDSIDTRINRVDCDIKKKLMVDASRGGYAIDTKILPSKKIPANSLGFTGVMVNIAVTYRTTKDDPYTQS